MFFPFVQLNFPLLHVPLHPNKRIDIFTHVWWDVSRGVIIAVSIECQT